MKKVLFGILFLIAMAVVFAALVDFSLWLDDIQNHRWKAVLIRFAVWTVAPPILYVIGGALRERFRKAQR